ncbi:hypothetical protein FB446DRAFT_750257 [Lentinula raphanica]|nr:hypothetical protein FB446DRAFT_750257 [Lentinula raphanica]
MIINLSTGLLTTSHFSQSTQAQHSTSTLPTASTMTRSAHRLRVMLIRVMISSGTLAAPISGPSSSSALHPSNVQAIQPPSAEQNSLPEGLQLGRSEAHVKVRRADAAPSTKKSVDLDPCTKLWNYWDPHTIGNTAFGSRTPEQQVKTNIDSMNGIIDQHNDHYSEEEAQARHDWQEHQDQQAQHQHQQAQHQHQQEEEEDRIRYAELNHPNWGEEVTLIRYMEECVDQTRELIEANSSSNWTRSSRKYLGLLDARVGVAKHLSQIWVEAQQFALKEMDGHVTVKSSLS